MARTATKTSTPAPPKLAPGIEARARILDAAEQLLGEHGLDGASLREISAAAGQANTSAVQYHFGGKEGLVAAIITRRRESFKPRRRALLADIEARGKLGDARELLHVFLLPLAEATDAKGRHVYARFFIQYLVQLRYQVPVEHAGLAPDQAMVRTGELLLAAFPSLGAAGLVSRLDRLTAFFLSAVIDRENALALGRPVEPEQDFLADLFTMVAGALAASARGNYL
jgi:AcrR family transcriptional regulator